ncbi:hypothetical protein [Candidatus Methanoperedens nitratireducens]|uniref:Uncharacterized protein n=1 Tax=Candidatus Methanoperedens nitratireducens TaxID=1392998 RepID=A0A284VRZ1_9EURY|nr:hypothetical protein [Candidatus Methanoperedens nitroreducens]SNQ62055.1 hypothetical protein MNV_580003 [Candidatus Methanoperedens nitroreducens]
MSLERYLINYLTGRLPIGEMFGITFYWVLAAIIIIWVYTRWERRKKSQKLIVSGEERSGDASAGEKKLEDVSYSKPSFPLPHGNFIIYCWERFRDGFLRMWYYNSFTVIRLKKTGKVDHRAYVVKPVQQNTINWDNCTYDVKNLFLIRRSYFMFVIEGCREPVDFSKWAEVMALVEIKMNKENYDTWSEEDKKKFGKFTFDAYVAYNKMNNRNAELLGMTGIPDMRIMFYGVVIAAAAGVILVLMMTGIIGSSMKDGFEMMRSGIVEVLKNVAVTKGG